MVAVLLDIMSYTKESLQKLLVDVITHQSPLKDVAIVLRAGADPNGTVTKGLRPIHYATYENHIPCMKLLIHHGANVNQPDNLGYTPMHIASKYGYYEAMETLLDNGAVVNFMDDGTSSKESKELAYLTVHPLNSAIENNQPKCVELLLQRGCDPNQKYFLGQEINLVPLEHLECLAILLKYGADPNAVSRGGLTALMKACREENIAAVQLLLRYKADVNFQCPPRFDQKRAIHFAASTGNVEICQLLLEQGADTGIPPDYKYGPLEVAIMGDKYQVCHLLLDHGANPNELNSEKCSLLQIACATTGLNNQCAIIEDLLQHGALPNFSANFMSFIGPCLTPLVEYFTNHDIFDINIIRMLVRYGARINFTLPTKLFKIVDPCGVLAQVRKLRPYEDILYFLIDVAHKLDVQAIKDESSLSNRQKELLLEEACHPRTLKHLTRLRIREMLRIPVLKSLQTLPLPNYLEAYLAFEVV